MSLKNTYFAIANPLAQLTRWLNPSEHQAELQLRDQPLAVRWTGRAERQMRRLAQPLLVEMQLYFSCVVKKRVLFHEQQGEQPLEQEGIKVNERLQVIFRTVQSNACDPVEFAAHYPEQRELDSTAAKRMHARALRIDYADGQWQGEFEI